MQKRVGLARAIATDPEVIFFDEPTAGLDPIMADVINDLIRELVTEMGATAVTITHDMTTVRTVADHVAMLHGGKVRWQGAIDEMDASPDPYLDQFIHGRADRPDRRGAVTGAALPARIRLPGAGPEQRPSAPRGVPLDRHPRGHGRCRSSTAA